MACQETDKNDTIEEKRENKLYVGNLDYRVTEYYVIKMFTPYGKILSEEYMWHTHGPKRGEPRGVAFVEFNKREEAEKAKKDLDGKLAFGRPLVVRFVDEKIASVEKSLPTKNVVLTTPVLTSPIALQSSRNAKITAIKNKLRAMKQEESEEQKEERVKRVKC